MHVYTTARALVYMTRPWNWARVQVPATLVGTCGGLYALRQQSPSGASAASHFPGIVWSMIAVATLSAGGYVINDYFDQDIDAVNEPNRPIPSGRVTAALALTLAIGLFVAGVVSAYLIGPVNFAIGLLWVAFAVWYAISLKRTGYGLQSLAFGVIMGLTAMFGSAAVLRDLSNQAVWFVAIFMALYITALHMTGTLKDIAGDAAGGCKTAAIVLGQSTTRALIPTVYLGSFLILLYGCWRIMELGAPLSALLGTTILGSMFFNVRALLGQQHAQIVKAHTLSKTLLYGIFLMLISHFLLAR